MEELRKLSPDKLRAFAQEVMGRPPMGATAAPATSSSAPSGTEAVTLAVTQVLRHDALVGLGQGRLVTRWKLCLPGHRHGQTGNTV